MPINHILTKCTGGYKHTKLQGRINQAMYMNHVMQFSIKGKTIRNPNKTYKNILIG